MLNFILTNHWWNEYESGRKKHEYRIRNAYWDTRVSNAFIQKFGEIGNAYADRFYFAFHYTPRHFSAERAYYAFKFAHSRFSRIFRDNLFDYSRA